MRIKLRQLFEAREVFNKIFNEPLEVKLSYRISKISKKINSELKDIEMQRISLIQKYADEQTKEEKEKRTPQKVTKKLHELIKEFEAFLDTEEEIDIQPIPFELLTSLKLSANDLNEVAIFIKEGDDNAKA
jgi:uncharacterized protein (UPF0248 family)